MFHSRSFGLWMVLAASVGMAATSQAGLGPPQKLRCEYRADPLGIDAPRPRLSWLVNDDRRGAVQSACRIVVSTDPKLADPAAIVWDTGKRDSDASVNVEYSGKPLESGKRYYWKVRTWDRDGQPSEFSEPAWFEMGLLRAEDFTARWITPASTEPQRSQYLRRSFQAKGPVARARVYATGLGLYELHLNGQRVSDDVFAPGWTKYDKRIQYQTYDVTGLLHQGDNAIAAVLGNGWWSGQLGWFGKKEAKDRRLLFWAQLRIDYADGSSETILTDASWKSHASPITKDSFYHGETCDARQDIAGWDQPSLDDQGWDAVIETASPTKRLCAQRDPPIRVTSELKAEQVSQPAKGTFIYDFGQNASGRVRLKVIADKGTQIRLRFGEVLNPDGTLYRDNYRSAQATDTYVCRGGGEETWEPIFTYRGFRFCEVTGWPGTPDRDALVFRVLHTDAPPAGTFECSNWLINRIQHCILWGQRSNMHSVPTDCPQRDERLGWMGDAQIFAPTACWNMNMAAFFSKWMADILDSQADDGAVTDVAPSVVVKGPAAPGWGDAVIVIPWTVYRFYGDTRIIEDNYDGMVRWVEYMRSKAKEGLLYDREGYGDWVPVAESPKAPIGAAYYFYSTKLLSRMAAAIGKKDDAEKYAKLAGQIADTFNARYLDPKTGSYPGNTQTASLIPLAFGITPSDKQETVLITLIKDILARGNHLSTGFIGTAYLLPTLTRLGNQNIAWAIATQCDYPSWGYMVLNGATTIWERWNSDKMGPSMNSRNHFAFGSVGQWYYESLAGIQPAPDAPGFKRIVIHPQPVGGLTWARATYESPYGPIESHWWRCDGSLTLEAAIPANTTARIFVPLLGSMDSAVVRGDWTAGTATDVVRLVGDQQGCRVYQVPAGRYRFTVAGK